MSGGDVQISPLRIRGLAWDGYLFSFYVLVYMRVDTKYAHGYIPSIIGYSEYCFFLEIQLLSFSSLVSISQKQNILHETYDAMHWDYLTVLFFRVCSECRIAYDDMRLVTIYGWKNGSTTMRGTLPSCCVEFFWPLIWLWKLKK